MYLVASVLSLLQLLLLILMREIIQAFQDILRILRKDKLALHIIAFLKISVYMAQVAFRYNSTTGN
jgi:hypothetical protein